MYRDSVDALTRLLAGIDDEGRPLEQSDISSVSSTVRTLSNGIRRCIVQVLFKSGSEYKIEAFGEEADELHVRARSHPMFNMLLA
jgi:hypothetical protein